jgi:hypothetical protein
VKRYGTVTRPFKIGIVVVVAAAVLTIVEHRILWGYWWRARSLIADMRAEQVEAIATLAEEEARGELRPVTGTGEGVSDWCGGAAPQSCVEGQTLLYGLGSAASGTVIRFTSQGQTYVWVKYSTHELEYDWHRAVQLLYRLNGSDPELVRSSVYRYQVAGLEDTPLWVLGILNAVVLASVFAVQTRRGQPATDGPTPTWKTIGAALLLLAGLSVGALTLYVVHRHDPWLVVLLIIAALIVAPAAYALGEHRQQRQKDTTNSIARSPHEL